MALFKTNPMFAGDPQVVMVTGSFVFTNTSAAGPNTVVAQALSNATTNAAGSAIGQRETVAPLGSKVACIVNPTTAFSPQIAPNANSPTIAVLDLKGYPSDIISVTCNALPAPSGTAGNIALPTQGLNEIVLGIDNTNMFVYVACTNVTGTPQNWANGISLHYQITFKDSYVP